MALHQKPVFPHAFGAALNTFSANCNLSRNQASLRIHALIESNNKDMLVYKYTSSDAGKLIIENNSLRFSQIEVLNDPFELQPSFDLYKKSIKGFVRNGFESRAVDFNSMTFIEQESWIQKVAKPSIDALTENLKEFLVLSLTKKRENLLMWSHYANSHRGLVIGFDYDNPFFNGIKPNVSIAYEVKYSKKRPAFFDYNRIRVRDAPKEEIINLLLTKSLWWEYEEEIRMFAHPSAATNVKKNENGLDIYLFDFPKECLKQIIFGSLMKSDEKREIAEITNSLYPNIELLEAIPSETEFALRFKPYKF
jgi:hypothetical protein